MSQKILIFAKLERFRNTPLFKTKGEDYEKYIEELNELTADLKEEGNNEYHAYFNATVSKMERDLLNNQKRKHIRTIPEDLHFEALTKGLEVSARSPLVCLTEDDVKAQQLIINGDNTYARLLRFFESIKGRPVPKQYKNFEICEAPASFDTHHKIPAHFIGSACLWNVIFLLPLEHALAHKVLYTCYKNINDLRGFTLAKASRGGPEKATESGKLGAALTGFGTEGNDPVKAAEKSLEVQQARGTGVYNSEAQRIKGRISGRMLANKTKSGGNITQNVAQFGLIDLFIANIKTPQSFYFIHLQL